MAKSGGHRSQMRIAPGGVPAYVDALRETNKVGDGNGRSKPALKWKPTASPPVTIQTDGEVPVDEVRLAPSVGEVPGDFVGIGYNALGGKLAQIVTGSDDWSRIDAQHWAIPWNDRSLLTERQTALESRRGQYQPRLHAIIEPLVMYYAGASGGPFSTESRVGAITSLTTKGSPKQRFLALEALEYSKHANV